MEANTKLMTKPGAVQTMTRLLPTGSTILKARRVPRKLAEAMMSPVAVALLNPTALNNVADCVVSMKVS